MGGTEVTNKDDFTEIAGRRLPVRHDDDRPAPPTFIVRPQATPDPRWNLTGEPPLGQRVIVWDGDLDSFATWTGNEWDGEDWIDAMPRDYVLAWAYPLSTEGLPRKQTNGV